MNKSQTQQKSGTDREIILSREFDAPRARVFDAWTHPDKIGTWWGPNGFTTTTYEMDFREGGSWRFMMHGPDGTDYPNRIVYTDIRKPDLMKYDHYGHEDGENDPPHFQVTVVFEDSKHGTKLTMRILFPSAEAKDEKVRFGAVEGGNQTLGRLAEFLGG